MFIRNCCLLKSCILMLFFVTTTLTLENNTFYVDCEPSIVHKAEYYIRKYNMTPISVGFTVKVVHKSRQVFPEAPLGNMQKSFGFEAVGAYYHVYELKKASSIKNYRTNTNTLIFHFYHGDTATCIHINPETRKYTETQIGFHVQRFYCIIPAGDYYSFEVSKHREEEFMFLGVTVIRGNSLYTNLKYYNKTEMKEKFPEYKDIIAKQQLVNIETNSSMLVAE